MSAPPANDAGASTQPTIAVKLTAVQAAGSVVRIQTTSGAEIVTFTPSKNYQSIVVSTPDLTNGTTYDVLINGSKVVTATATTTNTSTGGMGTPRAR